MKVTSSQEHALVNSVVLFSSSEDASWTLASKPIGSNSTLYQRTARLASLVLDKPGDYEVKAVSSTTGEASTVKVRADLVLNSTFEPFRLDVSWVGERVRSWIRHATEGERTAKAVWEALVLSLSRLLADLYAAYAHRYADLLPDYKVEPAWVCSLDRKLEESVSYLGQHYEGTQAVYKNSRVLALERAVPSARAILIKHPTEGPLLLPVHGTKGPLVFLGADIPQFAGQASWLVPNLEVPSRGVYAEEGDELEVLVLLKDRTELLSVPIAGLSSGYLYAYSSEPLLRKAPLRSLRVKAKRTAPLPSSTLSVPHLGDLREGRDYTIEGGYLRFQKEPDKRRLLAPVLIRDNAEWTWEFLGKLAGFKGMPLYSRAVKALLYALATGPSIKSLRVAAAAFGGLPFTTAPAEVEAIYEEAEYKPGFRAIAIREDSRSLTLPYPAVLGEPLYRVGQQVEPFEVLTRGVRIVERADLEGYRGITLINGWESWTGEGSPSTPLHTAHFVHYFIIALHSPPATEQALRSLKRFLEEAVRLVYTAPLVYGLLSAEDEVEVQDSLVPSVGAREISVSSGMEDFPNAAIYAASTPLLRTGKTLQALWAGQALLESLQYARLDLKLVGSPFSVGESVTVDGQSTTVKASESSPEGDQAIYVDLPLQEAHLVLSGAKKGYCVAVSRGKATVGSGWGRAGDILAVEGVGEFRVSVASGTLLYLREEALTGTRFALLLRNETTPFWRDVDISTVAGSSLLTLSSPHYLAFLRANTLVEIRTPGGADQGMSLQIVRDLDFEGYIQDDWEGTLQVAVEGGPPTVTGVQRAIFGGREPILRGAIQGLPQEDEVQLPLSAPDRDGALVGAWLYFPLQHVWREINRYTGSSRTARLRGGHVGVGLSVGDSFEVHLLYGPRKAKKEAVFDYGKLQQIPAVKASDAAGLCRASLAAGSDVVTVLNIASIRPNGKDLVTANTAADAPFELGAVQVGDLLVIEEPSHQAVYEVVQVIDGSTLRMSSPAGATLDGLFSVRRASPMVVDERAW